MEVDNTNPEEELLSVDALRNKLESEPNNSTIMEDLAIALMYRHMDGEEDHTAGDDSDLEELTRLIRQLPLDSVPYVRAYLTYLDEKDDETITFLEKWAIRDPSVGPLSADELYDLYSDFFGLSFSALGTLGERLANTWSDSAMTATLRGWGKVADEPVEAKKQFCRALDIDPEYWIAAWELAEILALEKRWDEAEPYYSKAALAEYARDDSDFLFGYASCLCKLKKFKEEEEMLRACLEVDPEYPSAHNDLGYSLYQQGRYEEALDVFNECINEGIDGTYPITNKARVLKKLGRYQEAIDA